MLKTIIRHLFAWLTALAMFLSLSALGETSVDIFSAAKGSAPQTVRVLLSRLALTDRLDVTLSGSYSVCFGKTELMFQRGSDLAILLKNGSLYLYYQGLSVDAGTDLTLARHPDATGTENGLRLSLNPSIYEGNLRLTVTDAKIRAILTLGVEDYLLGVVPYEMSDSYPLEALKAQAIAARTYAFSKIAANASKVYDLVDTASDQVYKGRRNEYTQSVQAVTETRGVCGFYQGKLAMCYYSASNGGQTELAKHVWDTQTGKGYLDIRDDPYDLENPQSKVQSVVLPKKTAEVTDAPYSLRLLLSTQLRDALLASGFDPSPESLRVDSVTAVSADTPRFDSPSRLYTMFHITFTYSARTRTDPVPTLLPAAVTAAVPTPGQSKNGNDDEEVSLFTPPPTPEPTPSPLPTPTSTPEPTPSPTPVPSYGPFVQAATPVTLDIPIFPDVEKALSLGINSYDNELITVTEQADSFTVESRRFGHGVGLSQRGAEWMAGKYAKTCTEILAFYYPGMTLMRYAEAENALPTVAPALLETAGPAPTATPRPTLMPLTVTPGPSAWYAEVTGIDDDSSLNLRATPDASGDIVMKLYKHQKLLVLEDCPQDGWVFVKTDAITGYVMEKFLTQTQSE